MKASIVFLGWQKENGLISQENTLWFTELDLPDHQLPLLTEVRILVLNSKKLKPDFHDFLKKHHDWLKSIIWIITDDPAWQLDEWGFLFQQFRVLKLIEPSQPEKLRQCIDEAWSLIRESEQNEIFNQLLNEKNLSLTNTQEQIKKEILSSTENKKALHLKLKNIEEWGYLLRQSLWIIHRSDNLKEVEELLLDLLKTPFALKFIELVISGSRSEKTTIGITTLKLTLHSEHADIATLWVAKNNDSPFSAEEKDFFNRLAEALEFAISRIRVIEDLAELEQQWQRSFDAITDPVVLTNETFEIIQTNHAATLWIAKNRSESTKNTELNTCYAALFGRNAPCTECRRNQKFELHNTITANQSEESKNLPIYEVSSHRIHRFNNMSFPIYIHLYRDVTHIKQMERAVVEQSSQLALGTLSSSIAHELNNPVGGILTLAQLSKMDFEISTKEYQAFAFMEKQALECKEIIETLLEFTHAHSAEPNVSCEIGSLIQQGFNMYKSIQENQISQFKLPQFEDQIYFQAKPKLLIDLFYLLFVNLQKLANETWILELNKMDSGFQIHIEPKSGNAIDPQFLGHTPFVQYFKSMGFKISINDSILEINFTST
jgi:hypothetical protein